MMKTKLFHVTWFIDEKGTLLAGTTVQAVNISEAINIVCEQNIQIPNKNKTVTIEIIKYVIEL